MSYAVDLDHVTAAAGRIAPFVHRTPVLTSRSMNDAAGGRRLLFKCENLQRTGSFKVRGAMNAVMALPEADAVHGVVTHSSGNFAQALAVAARERGIEAHIVMPRNAPAVKMAAVEGYGARIHLCRPTLQARETTAAAVQSETGATFIHPYNHRDVIAGQGTIGLELLEEAPDVAAVIAPIGGGGLMSGICRAVRGLRDDVRLLAAEPAGADDAARSLAGGRLVPQLDPRTIADGLLTSLGDLTWPIVRDHLERIVTVSDEAILHAMQRIWSRMKLVIEPSAAVPVAAVLSEAIRGLEGLDPIAIVLSGGNVDLGRMPFEPRDQEAAPGS
jgi:threonine dehydratase/serine racemase